tara:strand:- start:534 stop:794 length:261 start_codon:yes stop_codon:yes gene_type:complete
LHTRTFIKEKKETIITLIKLLEKLGANAIFDTSVLSVEVKNTLEDIIHKAKNFNAVNLISVLDHGSEDEPEKEYLYSRTYFQDLFN